LPYFFLYRPTSLALGVIVGLHGPIGPDLFGWMQRQIFIIEIARLDCGYVFGREHKHFPKAYFFHVKTPVFFTGRKSVDLFDARAPEALEYPGALGVFGAAITDYLAS
jgi:hypothetical protein